MPESGYDEIAGEYYDPGHVTSRNFDHATASGLERQPFNLSPTDLVLELGAGRGRSGEFLGAEPKQVVQLDNSPVMLGLPNRESCLLRVLADACRIPLDSRQFDIVVGFLVDPFLCLASLFEASRMLRSGGRLLLTTPTLEWGKALREDIGLDLMTTRFQILGTETKVTLPSLLHSKDRLAEMIAEAGFRDIEIEDDGIPNNEVIVSPDIVRVCRAKGLEPPALPVVHIIRATR